MPGWEWVVEQRTVRPRNTPPTWWVRTVEDPETSAEHLHAGVARLEDHRP
ncbi:hypothetical protein ABR738_00665 [Streptomyces sp. Edi4]